MNSNASSVKILACVAGFGCFLLLAPGCGGGFATIERPKGQIEFRQPEVLKTSYIVDPVTASQSKSGVDVTIRYASPEDLESFFEKQEIFGKLAGKNPYPRDSLIFYVKVANHSGKKLKVDPNDFVLIDNINIQYSELSPDDISTLYESKASMWSFAKTTGDLAPGPYGAPLKVAGALGEGSGRKMHYLIKQVRLAGGYVHPGIAYDGYVAFPRPHPKATSLRLVVGNLKTDFNPADLPGTALDFEFPFTLKSVLSKSNEKPEPKKPSAKSVSPS